MHTALIVLVYQLMRASFGGLLGQFAGEVELVEQFSLMEKFDELSSRPKLERSVFTRATLCIARSLRQRRVLPSVCLSVCLSFNTCYYATYSLQPHCSYIYPAVVSQASRGFVSDSWPFLFYYLKNCHFSLYYTYSFIKCGQK